MILALGEEMCRRHCPDWPFLFEEEANGENIPGAAFVSVNRLDFNGVKRLGFTMVFGEER